MAIREKLIKSKSLYTIKDRHATTSNGIIYENDHVTIAPIYTDDDGDTAIYPNSIFKYRIKRNENSKKKHFRGGFIKPDTSIDGESEYIWSLDNIGSCSTISSESKIIQKPNYTSLKDFAYYGSAVELIRATVNDVIMRFPGGLSYYGGNAPSVKISGTTYYYISNEFQIDCWTSGTISSEKVKNPMRILAASYMNYEICSGTNSGNTCSAPKFTKNTSNCRNSIIGTTNFGCGVFEVYMDNNGKKHLVTTTKSSVCSPIIRPKQEFIDKFWDTIDDFERVLLNRDSFPIYKSVFETPFITEDGHFYENKQYIWPTIGDSFTPDLTTSAFDAYLSSLLSLATYHDNYDTDNLWRMMTHESIKHLDWTFVDKNGMEDADVSDYDSKGMGAMVRIYGRCFDDIKRYADGIKSIKTLSYDGKNNMPDYFLSDKIEEDGWISKHVSPFESTKTTPISCTTSSSTVVIYPQDKDGSYVNTAFQTRLALSSNYIQSMKGTRRGIETILGMFGYSYDENVSSAGTFKIDEHVFLITSALSYADVATIRNYAENITEFNDIPHYLYDFPMALVRYTTEGGEDDEYLIPWYDSKVHYRYPIYFQSSGGWGKRKNKPINLPITQHEVLESNADVPIYGETQTYIKFASNIDEMLSFSYSDVFENMICYVTDISDIDREYQPHSEEAEDDSPYSHYFSLKNVNLLRVCGFLQNDYYNCYGWRNIKESEFGETLSDDAKRVLYLETIETNYKGNNPHIGNDKYDDGESYLENFTNIFKGYFEEGLFEILESEAKEGNDLYDIYQEIKNGTYGFKYIDKGGEIIDNKKCAYFHDYAYNGDLWLGEGEGGDATTGGGETPSGKKKIKASEKTDTTETETTTSNNTSEKWNSEPYKDVKFPDTPSGITSVADESQANAIINIKKIVITFGTGGNTHLRKYINDVVLKYLEEMIPSTAILEYRFDDEEIDGTMSTSFDGNGSFTLLNAAHVAVEKNNENVTTWREYPEPII